MPFARFVEVGRVAYIADGPLRGKLCTIVDVIDQTRALVDGPETGVLRQALRLNQLHITKYRLKFAHSARTRVVRKAWKESDIEKMWAGSTWAKRLEAVAKRRSMNDFDRYKLGRARTHRNYLRTTVFRNMLNKKVKEGLFKKRTKQDIAKLKSARKAKVAAAAKKK